MSILVNFIARFRESLLLLVYIVFSFFTMISSDSAIVEGLRSTTLFSLGFIQEQIDAIDSYFKLRENNRNLVVENNRLAFEKFQLQNALLENIRLRKLLQFKDNPQYDYIPAHIIGFSPQDFVTGYLISIPTTKPLQKNSAVITSEGLVGKIVKISGNYAICQNLFDPNSRVSVRVQRNRELGVIAWDGGNGLILEHIPNTVTIVQGDVLFTSGMSQYFPPDIKVGVVTEIEKNYEQLFQSIKVQPTVNLDTIEEVVIIQTR